MRRIALARIAVALVLAACALLLPMLRHRWIDAVTTDDAEPSEPAHWAKDAPAGAAPTRASAGLPRARRTRVVLIDGLGADAAHALPGWNALCDRGTRLVVDVGFPTISLPVEVALWTGLTQQQTGVVGHGDRALVPPLDRRGIPAQIDGSVAVAEDHGYIVHSLGFARVLADDASGWDAQWRDRARAEVAGDAALVFVHVLAVDRAGHHFGAASPEYADAARDADQLLATLVAAAPDARWFALSDHGHLAGGGHGDDERAIRQVEGCIAGDAIDPAATGSPPRGPVHVVDIARAIADSTGATLSAGSRGRPLAAALAEPIERDTAVPTIPIAPHAICWLVLVVAGTATMWLARRWWLGPWWLAVAIILLLAIRGEPTLSTPMTYGYAGRAMYVTWLPALAVAAATVVAARGVVSWSRAVAAQLVVPFALLVAAITACRGWPTVFGAEVAPVVPRITAWASALMLMLAHAAAAVALALLASPFLPAFDRLRRPEPGSSEP